MKTVKTIIDGKFIKVESPYNPVFIRKARQIQGRWDKPYWISIKKQRICNKCFIRCLWGLWKFIRKYTLCRCNYRYG